MTTSGMNDEKPTMAELALHADSTVGYCRICQDYHMAEYDCRFIAPPEEKQCSK